MEKNSPKTKNSVTDLIILVFVIAVMTLLAIELGSNVLEFEGRSLAPVAAED